MRLACGQIETINHETPSPSRRCEASSSLYGVDGGPESKSERRSFSITNLFRLTRDLSGRRKAPDLVSGSFGRLVLTVLPQGPVTFVTLPLSYLPPTIPIRLRALSRVCR